MNGIDWSALRDEMLAAHASHEVKTIERHRVCATCNRILFVVAASVPAEPPAPPPGPRRHEVVLPDGFVAYRGTIAECRDRQSGHPGALVRPSTDLERS